MSKPITATTAASGFPALEMKGSRGLMLGVLFAAIYVAFTWVWGPLAFVSVGGLNFRPSDGLELFGILNRKLAVYFAIGTFIANLTATSGGLLQLTLMPAAHFIAVLGIYYAAFYGRRVGFYVLAPIIAAVVESAAVTLMFSLFFASAFLPITWAFIMAPMLVVNFLFTSVVMQVCQRLGWMKKPLAAAPNVPMRES